MRKPYVSVRAEFDDGTERTWASEGRELLFATARLGLLVIALVFVGKGIYHDVDQNIPASDHALLLGLTFLSIWHICRMLDRELIRKLKG